MAIKKVGILLTIDTGEKEEPSFILRADTSGIGLKVPGADETYLINVSDSHEPGPSGKPNKLAMLTSAAHELGHALTAIFRVKGGMHDDPRARGEFQNVDPKDYNVDQAKRIWMNETLAWNIAEKIRPDLDYTQKAKNLASYREFIDKVEKEEK